MNRSNYHYPPNPDNCCCYCPSKQEYSHTGGRDAKYAESYPSEDDEDEDEFQSFRNNEKTFTCDEIYDNLMDLIDDQMMSTMSSLRKKARQFMKSEFEHSFSSDTTNRRCNKCAEDTRSKGTSVVKKANEIDYQPQSAFLKKMVQQYQYKQSDYSELCESDSPAAVEKCARSKNMESNLGTGSPPPIGNQKEKRLGSCCCKCAGHESPDSEQENSKKKSEHVSRWKKKTKCRGKRKRGSKGNCESGDRFEPDLKQPHENSCERCWRFASPSRSPVNKPDQRYDPNFRRGHSCVTLGAGKGENPADVKGVDTSTCKNQQTVLVTPDVTRNIMLTSTPKRKPKVSVPDRSIQIQNVPCEDYSTQYAPLSKGTPMRSRSNEQSKSPNETRAFDFEYPSFWSSETLQTPQPKYTPRPHSCDRLKKKEPIENEIIYSSKVRNLLTRPQSYIPATCNNNNREEEYHGTQQYRDICGRGRLQNIDPCMRRSPLAKKEDPCQGMDMSTPRGDISRGSGLGNGLESGRGSGLGNVLESGRGSGLGNGFESGLGNGIGNALGNGRGGSLRNGLGNSLAAGRDDFDKSPQSDIPVNLNDPFNDSSQKASSGKKSKPGDADNSKDKSPGKKPSSANKSPKTKSPKSPKTKSPKSKSPKSRSPTKTPKGSPRGSKDRKGSCSTNEAQPYFKIPGEPKSPDFCGTSHPIRKCQCYPRVLDDLEDDDVYCCHCGLQSNGKDESARISIDEADSPRIDQDFSPRSSFPESSTFQGRRSSPSPNRGYNQKATLPNIDEYPEQLFDLNMDEDNCIEMTLPCPYRSYMNKRPFNTTADGYESRCQRGNLSARNGNYSFRDGNASFRNEGRNASHMAGNDTCPGYGNGNASYRNESRHVPHMGGNEAGPGYRNGNASFGNNGKPSPLNDYGMEYPRKYCVMYMTKGKENSGDDVEVLVEELSQPCPHDKDGRMANVSEKMTRMFKCPTESMALRFQKGVSARNSVPQKSRVLYF